MKPLTKEIVSPNKPSVKRMSDESIKIAIAGIVEGWEPEVRWMYAGQRNVNGFGKNTHLSLGHPDRRFVTSIYDSEIPDYTHDLNAMHEAEELLHKSFEDSSAYEHFLRNVVYKTKHSGVGIGFATLNATAAQRAEAFLRTKGKWNDSI